jgi:hypothetical protein
MALGKSNKTKKIRDPKRFSTQFGLDSASLKALGAFDPLLNADTPLFIDPLLLPNSAHTEMRSAYGQWVAHFTDIIRLLKAAQDERDPAWRAADRRMMSKEFKGTCLGYGSGTIAGSGIGPGLRARIMRTAHQIVALGIEDPKLFPLLALLEEGVGPDRISDLTTRVVGGQLAQYTVRVLDGKDVARGTFNISETSYQLPVNPLVSDRGKPLPVVLVPLDVLRDLPIASDWSDIDRVASHNAALRARINAAIGDIWERHSRESKGKYKRIFLASRDAFETLLAATEAIPKRPYDAENDPDGWLNWLELGQAAASAHPLQLALFEQNIEDVRRVVSEIIEHYKYAIEYHNLWKSLYDSNGEPHHESYAQRLFYAMALSYCKANDLAISPEVNSGRGPVDFVVSRGFHARVVVELKLSGSSRLRHGYTTQLEEYKASEETDEGFYVILDMGDAGKQLEDVLELEAAARNAGEKYSPVIVADARPKKSASKF